MNIKLLVHFQLCNSFSGKIICGDCGSIYGCKIWHSTSKYRRTIWQCNAKFTNEDKCTTPHLNEETIKGAFVGAFNSILTNANKVIKDYKSIITELTDTTLLDKETKDLKGELKLVTELLEKCVEGNAHTEQHQTEYREKYESLSQRFADIQTRLSILNEQRLERINKQTALRKFMNVLKKQKNLLTEFDENLWFTLLENVTVYVDKKLTFCFKDGLNIDWTL